MKSTQGFSLLEILVVLLIVGLFSAMSVAWLDSGQAPVQQALQELAAEARIQAAQARHSGQVLGLRWNGKHPEFVRLQQDQSTVRWQVEATRLKAWPAQLSADWSASAEPQVVFTPAGVAGPAVVNWHWPEGQQRWQWRADNSLIQVTQP